MNFLMTIAMKALGLQSAVDALDGETSKAYIGGCGMIFGGVATALGGLVNILQEVLPLHGAADYFRFAQGLSHDTNLAILGAGWLAIHNGYAVIGNRHATAVLSNAIAASNPTTAAAPAASAAPVPAAAPAPAA